MHRSALHCPPASQAGCTCFAVLHSHGACRQSIGASGELVMVTLPAANLCYGVKCSKMLCGLDTGDVVQSMLRSFHTCGCVAM